ncbi:MAG TPA: CHAT domain-containing protein [Verrucomicrobiae bacterium]
MPDYRFQYVLTMPPQDLWQASPFFGFTPGILESVQYAFELLRLPRHPLFFRLTKDQKRAWAMAGGTYQFQPAHLDALPVFRHVINQEIPLWCFVSTDETMSDVSSFLETIEHPTLHLCAAENVIEGGISLWGITAEDLYNYSCKAISFIKAKGGNVPYVIEEVLKMPILQEPPDSLNLEEREHYLTLANETVLKRSNYALKSLQKLSGASNDPYIRAICDSADQVDREQNRIGTLGLVHPPTFTTLLCCASFYRHVYAARPGKDTNEVTRRVFNSFRRQTKYFSDGDRQTLADLATPEFQSMVGMYRQEIDAFSKAIAVKATNSFAPVIRLPPVLNQVQDDVDKLARCTRGDNPHLLFKQEKLFRTITKSLINGVPAEYYKYIDSPHNRIKLVGNVPLEWLEIRGIPMMIRYETSRIPSTPGNVMFDQCVVSREVAFPASALDETLVIRAYEATDPVRHVLEVALRTVRISQQSKCRFRIQDVSSIEEFIEVVNSFKGALMVFDGHGSPSISDVGKVSICGKLVDLYEFRTRLRVPPIVLLSSCDTHAIDGDHASVGNTFLMLGAMTVVATLLPVSATDAAVFVARLYFRIAELLPGILSSGGETRWSSFVSGMQKQVYISEQIRRLYKLLRRDLPFRDYYAIHTAANDFILKGDLQWYEKSVLLVANHLNATEEAIRKELKSRCQLVDIVKYVQLGNPDQILFVGESDIEASTITGNSGTTSVLTT